MLLVTLVKLKALFFGFCLVFDYLLLVFYHDQWRSKLDDWGEGHIFIYSSSQTMKIIDFKRKLTVQNMNI